MKKIVVLLGMLVVVFAGGKMASAGPIIIDGTDSNDHGLATGSGNVNGWKYMQEALEHLSDEVYTGTARVVVNLGASNVSTGDPGCDRNAWEAIHSAFQLSSLPGRGWTIIDVDGITGTTGITIPRWLNQLSTANTGIVAIPTFENLCGDLNNGELDAINANTAAIINFVNGPGGVPRRGGALFALSERSTDPTRNPFGWLKIALPGLQATGFGDYDTPLSLTADGQVAFPGLTNADLSTGPWHNWFEGNFGGLSVLATATSTVNMTRPVILGGGAGTRFGPRTAELIATKVDTILGGAGGQVALPGDTLVYSITLTNIDNADVITGVTFTDAPDPNTTLVTGTVTTSQGSVTSGNSAGNTSVAVNVGTINPGASVVIVFRVKIANPLPGGTHLVANQGFVSLPGGDLIRTDDPNTPVLNDPTVTHITDLPILSASKTDRLYADADNNGIPSAGDSIAYTITVENNGVTATQVTFVDIPGLYTRLVTGSVSTTAGAVTSGNGSGDTSVTVNIGTLPGGHNPVVIAFRVMIENNLPPCPTQAEISNQGFVTSNEVPTILTDDPDTITIGDPTITPLCNTPLVELAKRAVLIGDNDLDGKPSPGDVLLYEVEMVNNGNTAATGVVFRDTPDSNTVLLTGTVNSTGGSVILGNNPGDTSVEVAVGTIPAAHGIVNISFRVRINSPLPGVTQVSNQGSITSTQVITPLLSDDPDTPPVGDPTVTRLSVPGLLSASKIGELFGDLDHNGVPSPGDVLLYKVSIKNAGGQVVSDVVFTDPLDPNTHLVTGTVQTSAGSVTRGNNPGDTSVRVDIPSIAGGQSADITYRASIAKPMPAGVLAVTNQGVITSTGGITVTDDPTYPGFTPTVVTVTVETELQLTAATDVGQCVLPGSSFNVTWTVANVGNVAFGGGLINLVVTGSGSAPGTIVVPAIPTNTVQMVVASVSVSQPIPYGAEAITLTGSILSATAVLPVSICAPNWLSSTASVDLVQEFVNDQITYTWHISNTGDADASGTYAVFTLPQAVAGSEHFDFQNVGFVSSGVVTVDLANNRLIWTGDVPQGTGVTVVFHAHVSFGFPHQILEADFMINHPWRPPFIGKTTLVYPYRLFFMIVVKNASVATFDAARER